MFNHRRHVFPLVLAAACWGGGAVASKRAVEEIPATILLVVQLAASVIALGAIVAVRRVRMGGSRLAWLGVLNPGLAYLLSLAGLATIPASLSVLLWTTEPILIIALAWLLLKEPIAPRTLVLASVAVVGAALAAAAGTGGGNTVGIVLTLGGVLCCAVYTVATRNLLGDHSALGVVTVQQLAAFGFGLAVVFVQLLAGGIGGLGGASTTAWMSAVLSGVLYYGLAFWAYLAGLGRSNASTAAIYFNLIPLFGIAGSYLFLRERLEARQLVGAATVMVAVGLLTRPRG
jgi:drug/metabolite transporter (DMT)-like permease